mgnify:CR=1 FL=1
MATARFGRSWVVLWFGSVLAWFSEPFGSRPGIGSAWFGSVRGAGRPATEPKPEPTGRTEEVRDAVGTLDYDGIRDALIALPAPERGDYAASRFGKVIGPGREAISPRRAGRTGAPARAPPGGRATVAPARCASQRSRGGTTARGDDGPGCPIRSERRAGRRGGGCPSLPAREQGQAEGCPTRTPAGVGATTAGAGQAMLPPISAGRERQRAPRSRAVAEGAGRGASNQDDGRGRAGAGPGEVRAMGRRRAAGRGVQSGRRPGRRL